LFAGSSSLPAFKKLFQTAVQDCLKTGRQSEAVFITSSCKPLRSPPPKWLLAGPSGRPFSKRFNSETGLLTSAAIPQFLPAQVQSHFCSALAKFSAASWRIARFLECSRNVLAFFFRSVEVWIEYWCRHVIGGLCSPALRGVVFTYGCFLASSRGFVSRLLNSFSPVRILSGLISPPPKVFPGRAFLAAVRGFLSENFRVTPVPGVRAVPRQLFV
jgi:hypothetical protein